MKIGVLPDRVLMSLMNDRMIAKGTILDFITAFFQDYLSTDSMEDLVQLLRKARLDDRLLDFFPPQRRNLTDFDAHFKASMLGHIPSLLGSMSRRACASDDCCMKHHEYTEA